MIESDLCSYVHNSQNYDLEVQSGNYAEGYVSERIQFQEQKRLTNIRSVVQKVAHELGDKEVPDQEPDHDWTATFFCSVQDVSSKEMQILLAKILASQIERPGNTSLRTLGILQEMDRNMAELFERFCSMCMFLELFGVSDGRVCSLGKNAGQSSLKSFGLDFYELNRLNEYGLIISDYNSWYGYSIPQQLKEIKYIFRLPSTSSKPFRFQENWWCLIPTNTK
ncbi:MAG: DUF2806 domain-containing protein [Rhodobacteraceae bacterium]|nr:DUF2806 domain-containing protein [Paracoccaceae bacterium]MCY4249465.1 DUF2806 domain-containing protein [Paracoccaceae bacterium]